MTFFKSRRAPQEDTSFDDLVSSGRIWQCPTVSRIRGIVGTRQLLPAVGLPQFIRNWVSPIVKDRLRHLTSPPAPLSRLERGSTTANFARTSPLSEAERGFRGEVNRVSLTNPDLPLLVKPSCAFFSKTLQRVTQRPQEVPFGGCRIRAQPPQRSHLSQHNLPSPHPRPFP